MTHDSPLDEMADATGHTRPHWRSLQANMFALGHDALTRRARLLAQEFEEEGTTAILPGERTVQVERVAHALGNRRLLARIVPELFQGQRIGVLRPCLDTEEEAA